MHHVGSGQEMLDRIVEKQKYTEHEARVLFQLLRLWVIVIKWCGS